MPICLGNYVDSIFWKLSNFYLFENVARGPKRLTVHMALIGPLHAVQIPPSSDCDRVSLSRASEYTVTATSFDLE